MKKRRMRTALLIEGGVLIILVLVLGVIVLHRDAILRADTENLTREQDGTYVDQDGVIHVGTEEDLTEGDGNGTARTDRYGNPDDGAGDAAEHRVIRDSAGVEGYHEGRWWNATGAAIYFQEKPLEINVPAAVNTNPLSIRALVNREYRLPEDYVPQDLVEPDVPFALEGDEDRKKMRAEAAHALEILFEDAKELEMDFVAVSGYRSYERQTLVYLSTVSMQGLEEANEVSAIPGSSEHQTGLVMDVSCRSSEVTDLTEDFGETREGKWLADNAWRYGFIVRYPADKEAVTGYSYEPWHIRYVGLDLAELLRDQELTLDEYYGWSNADYYFDEEAVYEEVRKWYDGE